MIRSRPSLHTLAAPIFGAAVAFALPLSLLACGGSGQSQTASCKSTDLVVHLSEYRFQPKALHASAGKRTFCLVNAGSMQHDLVIGTASSQVLDKSDVVVPGDTTRFTATLQAGSYLIWCDVPGHRAEGMSGTLAVS